MEGLFARPDELVYCDETADQARERFGVAVSSVLEDHEGANIGVVAHGTGYPYSSGLLRGYTRWPCGRESECLPTLC